MRHIWDLLLATWLLTCAGLLGWCVWVYLIAPVCEFLRPGALARLADRLLPLPPRGTR